jgi:hypothetical protein
LENRRIVLAQYDDRMMRFSLLALVLCVSCDSTSPPAAPYHVVTDVLHTMEWILDPAADVIWDSAGFVITEAGETDLQPTTLEGWAEVRNAAAVIAESGNLLMMPGRSAGPEWIAYAQALTASGVVSMAAAEAQDADALFDAGGQVYQACRACHEQYLVPIQAARDLARGSN